MKLDRNTNRGGRGKYALVNMRKLIPLIDKCNAEPESWHDKRVEAFELLVREGIITLGNESPGEQFFVMKYKDKFTSPALHAYAIQAEAEAIKSSDPELKEYAAEMFKEAKEAEKLGNRIPD